MDKKWFERFSDRDHWESLVQTYIQTGTAPEKTPSSYAAELWGYFKFCILTDNRFFFEHPLLDVVRSKIGQHVISLSKNTTLFRARIDSENELKEKASNLRHVKILTEMREENRLSDETEFERMIEFFTGFDGYDTYRQQYENGFGGFSADECVAPPAYQVVHGRCNLPNSPHLYAATDIHTAIVETRPYIQDTISVASLCCDKELKIIDLCFNWDDKEHLHDWFFMAMSSEFSAVNKGNESDYFATQYITMLIKSLGYDGLRFKSSLVVDGVNYVIFDDSACKPISSKLYTVVQARYDVLSVDRSSALKDANGEEVPDPPLTRIK